MDQLILNDHCKVHQIDPKASSEGRTAGSGQWTVKERKIRGVDLQIDPLSVANEHIPLKRS